MHAVNQHAVSGMARSILAENVDAKRDKYAIRGPKMPLREEQFAVEMHTMNQHASNQMNRSILAAKKACLKKNQNGGIITLCNL